MKRLWDKVFGLDEKRSIWVEEADLGSEIPLVLHKKRYFVKIPASIGQEITLRLRGLGKKRGSKSGDLFLHVWLNKGQDIYKDLWISATTARMGADKSLTVNGKTIMLVIPPNSTHGLTIRLKGYGAETEFSPHAPVLAKKKKGNLLVKLFVFPDDIRPVYGNFDALTTENMFLEGWVYRKFDEVMEKIGDRAFRVGPLRAAKIADLFNAFGWRGIFRAIKEHLSLGHLTIHINTSATLPTPGRYEKTVTTENNVPVAIYYTVTINNQFLDDPFLVAAILAHELCHIVYAENFGNPPTVAAKTDRAEQETLEAERTVDLLVFMFKVGEFQLRVARDKRLTLGYFNQEVFERMQVIVSRKLNLQL